MTTYTDQYSAMGSPFAVRVDLLCADKTLEAQVRQLFSRLRMATETMEQCLSRFRRDSELTQLNARVGEAVRISPLLSEVLKKTEVAYRISGRMFDPRVIRVLQTIGYAGALDSRLIAEAGEDGADWIVWHEDDVVEIAAPIDLGGIGKGYTVDFLAKQVEQTFSQEELAGVLVNAGGDVRLYGRQDSGEPWTVGVENPFSPTDLFAAIRVADESVAVCTSSKWKRKWRHGDREVHHLIDPQSGQPASTSVMSVTALGTEAAMTEILTKMVFIGDEAWRDEQARYLVIDASKGLMYTPPLAEQLIWVTPDASRVQPLKAT